MPPRRTAFVTIAVATFLAAWFLWNAWPGLFFGFSGDDMMNTYLAWDIPVPRIVTANLTPFTAVYRPTGTAFYRILYTYAGFEPLPFRAVNYALMLLNIWIGYRFVKQLTASAEIGLLAALLAAYHPHLNDLYTNGGTIYDILCYTFFLGAITLYAAGRRGLSFIALCILALNSKEMAVTLPAVLWIYELIFDPRSLTPRCLFQRNKLALWILTIATPIAIAIKRGPQGAFANNPDYAVHLDAAHFLASTQSWMSQFLLQPDLTLSFTMAAALLLLPLAAGLLFHHKPLLFFGAFVILTPLPVNFIAPRGFFVMYLPLIAWAGSLAIALTALRDRLARPSFPARAILLLSAAALLYYAQSLGFHPRFAMADPSQANNRSLHAALTQHCPSLPSGGHILLRDDPFDPGYWDPLFVARLTYHDKTATLERTKSAAERPLTPGRQYDCTLAFDGSSYKRK